MSPQSIVCTTCDAAVPYGRLSCPSCGELLASVAGAARPTKPRAAAARAAKGRATERAVPATPAVLVDVPPPSAVEAPLEAAAAADGAQAMSASTSPAPEDIAPAYEPTRTGTLDWDPGGWDPTEPGEGGSTDGAREASTNGSQGPATRLAAQGWEPPIFGVAAAAADDPGVADAGHGAATEPAAGGFSTVAWPADQVPPVPVPTEARTPIPTPAVAPAPAAARPPVPGPFLPDAPGAYVPPIVHAEPAGAPAPARSWAGQAATNPGAEKPESPRASMAGDLLDAGRVTEFVGWLTVAGSAMAAVGFLLPWGVSVIGASGVGYFDRWGLAGPFHLVVFLSLLATLALSLLPNKVPPWLRVGLLGLGLGALLLGLTWPYLLGLTGTGPGAMVVAVGALLLGVAGVVALATDRHAHEDQAV